MRDKATAFETDKTMFDYVKGHTKIELTDINTGETKVIEKDNTFQSAVLAQYMRSMGAYNNNPYSNSTWAGQSVWRNLVGGLLLFKDAIDLSNGDVEYMPAGNVMTGNGAYGVTNSGTPVELGSYNSVESVTSGPDSLTFVYDFTTSQAVGDIACVCLTSEIGGYIGYGNKSGTAHATAKALNANQSSNSLSGILYNNFRWAFSVDNSNLEVTVTKTPTEATKGSVFDNIAEAADTYSYATAITGTNIRTKDLGNGKVAIYGYDIGSSNYQMITWAANASKNYLLFDMDTETITEKTVTNTTGIALGEGGDRTGGCLYDMVDGYIIAPKAFSEPRYAINLDDGTYFELASGSTTGISREQSYLQGKLADNLVFLQTADGIRIADLVNATAYPCNASSATVGYTLAADDVMSNGSQIFKNPLYLATVNNLVSPVNKTAAQTMKVTYTLTKA